MDTKHKCEFCGKQYFGTDSRKALENHKETCRYVKKYITIPKDWLTKEIGANLK